MRSHQEMLDKETNLIQQLRKYARIFVLEHYLLLVAHRFPRATLSENCSPLGTDPSIFSHQMEAIGYIFPYFQNCPYCKKDLKDN